MAKANLLPALGEGFRLIGREPLSVLAWGLVSLAAALIPGAMYFALMGPGLMGELRGALSGDDAAPALPAAFALSGLVQLVQWAAAIVSGAVVYSAVFRAVLRPEERGLARMKLGSDELYVGIVMVVLSILLIIAMIVLAIVLIIPVGVVGALASGGDGGGMAALTLIPLLIIGLLGAAAVLYSRFGLSMPMTFAERRMKIFEAWQFSKGYGWQLLLLAFLQLLILLGIYLAVLVVIMVTGVAAVGFGASNFEALMGGDAGLGPLIGFVSVAIILYALLLCIVTPIMIAPWARAYQLIAGDRLEGRTEVFS